MHDLPRVLLYHRDWDGWWVPDRLGALLGAGIALFLAYMIWHGLRRVREGGAGYWREVWWAGSGYVYLGLGLVGHAYRIGSPPWNAIAIVAAAVFLAWLGYGVWRVWPLWRDEAGAADAASEEAPSEVEEPEGERSPREQLFERLGQALAEHGEQARRRTSPWRQLSTVCSAIWKLSLLGVLVAVTVVYLWVSHASSSVGDGWGLAAILAEPALVGLAGLAALVGWLAERRLTKEVERLESRRAEPTS